jgi:hypothetical protein
VAFRPTIAHGLALSVITKQILEMYSAIMMPGTRDFFNLMILIDFP